MPFTEHAENDVLALGKGAMFAKDKLAVVPNVHLDKLVNICPQHEIIFVYQQKIWKSLFLHSSQSSLVLRVFKTHLLKLPSCHKSVSPCL